MKRPLYARIAVLSFFILFLISFIAYRSGYFEKRIDQPAPHQEETYTPVAWKDMTFSKPPVIDSPPRKRTMFPSSKVMILPEQERYEKLNIKEKSIYDQFDTSYKKKLGLKQPREEIIMISSSKSGAMIPIRIYSEPAAYEPIYKQDTAITFERIRLEQRMRTRLDTIKHPDSPIMKSYIPGSKSGRLIPVPLKKNKK